ncbi:PAS domain S-box protein [Methylomonas sp. EFPC3]|uniref:PAS domain-containing protein n=1 Tax=Methylomonas sp. EFPC3 TaxID=3021710 RepID=UPI0024171199|nr:PAS domain-containing protein [Methylomonas sp. EFPC3]WFP49572.1 PAS domain S-box protein [Methylomonas sp. EFPC3]
MPHTRFKLNDPYTEIDWLYGIVASIDDAVLVLDAKHQILYANPAAESLFGLAGRKLAKVGEWQPALYHADRTRRYLIADELWPASSHAAEASAVIDLYLSSTDNTWIPLSLKIRRIDSPQGQAHLLLFSSRPPSPPPAPAESAAEVLEHSPNLSAVLNHMPAMIGYWDRNLHNRFGNTAYEEWFGFTPSSMLGKHIRDVIGDKLYGLNQPYLEAVLAGEPQFFERTIVDVSGRERYTQTAYLPDYGDGRVNGFFVLVTDVTELKSAQKRIGESAASLRAIYDNLPFLAWMKDRDGRYLQANKHWLQAVGIKELQALDGITDYDIWPRELAEHYLAVDREVMHNRRQIQLTERAFDAGRETWTETIKSPVIGESGEVLGTTGLARDITEQRVAEDTLRNYSERLRLATQASAIGICEWEIGSGQADWDPRMYQMFGIAQGTPIDYEAWAQLVVQEDLPRCKAKLRKLIHDRREQHWEFRIRRQNDGSLRYIQAAAIVGSGPNGEQQKIVGVNIDVTRYKTIENALRDSEAHLAHAQAQAHLGSWRLDADRTSLHWSDENYRIFGTPLGAAVTYQHFLDCVHPDDRAFIDQAWQAAMNGAPYDIQHRILVNGQLKWLRERAELDFDSQGRFLRAVGTSQDITELKEIERDLEYSRSRLRQLYARREKAREEERRRIAREIHDELGQMLTALRMQISLMRLRFAEGNAELAEKIRDTMLLLDKTIEVTRDVATSLRPSALEMGIVPALQWHIKKFSDQSGIACDFSHPDNGPEMDEECATALFRIVQESLTNVLKHSGADKVKIRIAMEPGFYYLEICDNGRGFAASDARKAQSFGLIGIQERAIMLGGTSEFLSTPDTGTTIRVRVPATPNRYLL